MQISNALSDMTECHIDAPLPLPRDAFAARPTASEQVEGEHIDTPASK